MKSQLYLKLLAELNMQKRDLQFNPELLDKLTSEEREVIEKKLYELCMNGVQSAIKYIPYIVTINIESLFEERNLLRYPSDIKCEICKYGYLASSNKYLLDEIANDAKVGNQAYIVLNDLYLKTKHPEILVILENIKSGKYNNVEENYDQYDKFHFFDINGNELSADYIKKIKEELNQKDDYEELSSLLLNGVIGFAIGDALGVPVEFKSRNILKNNPVTDMLEYGTHRQPKGTWSDDTSTMIATMDSISSTKKIDYNDMMQRFCDWYKNANYTATDVLFDIGIATSNAIANYIRGVDATKCGPSGTFDNGNGSLMRMLPIAIYCYYNNLTEEEEVELINKFSSMTHGHDISKLGCKIYSDYIKKLIVSGSKHEAYREVLTKDYSKYYTEEALQSYNRILNGDISKLSEEEISGSGYVVHSLEASLWCTLNSDNYEEAVLKAINLGDDTDTVGAITGGINGIIYGLPSIKKEWKMNLKKIDYLYNLSSEYAQTLVDLKKKDINLKKI